MNNDVLRSRIDVLQNNIRKITVRFPMNAITRGHNSIYQNDDPDHRYTKGMNMWSVRHIRINNNLPGKSIKFTLFAKQTMFSAPVMFQTDLNPGQSLIATPDNRWEGHIILNSSNNVPFGMSVEGYNIAPSEVRQAYVIAELTVAKTFHPEMFRPQPTFYTIFLHYSHAVHYLQQAREAGRVNNATALLRSSIRRRRSQQERRIVVDDWRMRQRRSQFLYGERRTPRVTERLPLTARQLIDYNVRRRNRGRARIDPVAADYDGEGQLPWTPINVDEID